MKKIYLTLTLVVFSCNLFCQRDHEMIVETVFIPDTAFLYALIDEGVDTNGDSLISYAEAEAITTLDVSQKGIIDLSGVETFINLTELRCADNKLTSVDLTNNLLLRYIWLSGNPISKLDLSNNTLLHIAYLANMPSLTHVCISPFPFFREITGSPNVYFTASCASHIKSIPGDYASIQVAIEAAADGDTLIVEEGTYYENINFLGKAITVASRFIWDADTSHISKTIIDGSQSTNPDTASVVIMRSGEDTTSVLMGLTITGGTGTNYSWSRSDGSSVTDRAGGGIFILGSGGKIMHNIIEGNHVEQTGGPESQYGGGFCGSLYHNHSLIFRKNIVRSNGVKAERASGGGIFVDGGRILCEYNEIINNSAHASGMVLGGGFCGFYYEMEGTLKEAVIRNNLISGNSAITNSSYGGGGGLYQGSGYGLENIHVYNNIICKNHSSYIGGGAFFWDNTQGRVYNNTIVENTAVNAEGRNVSFAYGVELAVYNNIIWSNENISIPDIQLIETESARLKIFNNIIMNSLAQNNMVTAFNNWYDKPIFQSGSYAHAEGSPGIGWGMDSQEIEGIWCNAPAYDFYGNPRPHSLDKYVDLGAIESAFEKTLIIGEKEKLIHSGLSFYPNPTPGLLTIQNFDNDKCNFEIISLNGQVVFNGKMHGPSVQIDLSPFPSGMYFLTLRSENSVRTEKIIKLVIRY